MQKSKFNVTFQFILTFCMLSCVPYLYFHSQFYQLESQTRQYVEQENLNRLEFSKVELQHTLDKVTVSLGFLANNGVLNRAVLEPSKHNLDLLKDFWLLVAQTQGYYSQLRFIDTSGMELVRINSSERVSEIVDNERLQYKGDRDYFSYAQSLDVNSVGTFGIDYEVENGNPILPLVPAYRVIYPVTIDGQRLGYFVANLNLRRIHNMLAYRGDKTNLPTIVNSDGYYLMTPSGEALLGHLFEETAHQNVSVSNPKLWRNIQLKESGTVEENDQWISFVKTPLKGAKKFNTLILMFEHNKSDIEAYLNEEKTELFMQAGFVLIITLFISFAFVNWSFNHEKNSLDSKIALAAMNGMSAVVITDRDNKVIQVNDEFTRVSGYSLEDVIGQSPSLFSSGQHGQQFYTQMWHELHENGVWEGEVVNKRRDGSFITEILRIQTIKTRRGSIEFYVASFVDITHRKELEDRLRTLSEKDSLTGLSNRRKFDSDMQVQLQRSKRYTQNEVTTLALLDIDYFKRVNDQYGHDKGDEVIKNVASALRRHLRETDMLSRIGGEEFAIIMPHTAAKEAEVVLNRLRTAIHIESELGITVSIGFSQIAGSTSQTYKRADTALYLSKESGRNQVSEFSLEESQTIA